MTGVHLYKIEADDVDLRLDRWFKQKFPDISHGRLEKLLRTGQIRIDGRRVKANFRVSIGQEVRVPPIGATSSTKQVAVRNTKEPPNDILRKVLVNSVLHLDEEILAISKPPGVSVQGGTGTKEHIDGALDALRFGSEWRPKLVHRLDKDTSGVLLLARTRHSAKWLTRAFREQVMDKTYWGIVVGDLRPVRGKIDLPIIKLPSRYGEKMIVDHKQGQRAITDYAIVEQLGRRAAWIAMRPRTGRTHQLRVHMAALGTPILGDGKYGGKTAFLDYQGLSRKMHLHARDIRLKRKDGTEIFVEAELPEHVKRSWMLLGMDNISYKDPFVDLKD